MHSHSNQQCRRARLLSALKLSDKPNKDLGISSVNFKRAKAYLMPHPKPAVKPTLDQCDPLLVALSQSVNTSTSQRYECQRSTKVPVRVPAGFPVNQNFSQRIIHTFENVKDESELEESDEDEDDQRDPFLAALARSAKTSTSQRYASQRSEKVPLRVPAGFPTNRNFSQTVIHTFDVKEAKVRSTMVKWTPATPVRGPRGTISTPTRMVSSTLETPGLTISSSSTTSSVGSTIGSSLTTPTYTSSPSRRTQLSVGSSVTTPSCSSTQQPKQITKLYTIHEALLSPSGLPSPSPVVIHRSKSYAEIMAGLEFLNKFYGEMGLI
ncbi:hypothetical protein DFH28DRAFT_1030049 [Melampsora americana]|nr:hypothetical protein DFH28DRAFT_1030049 [Melampsora americana]